jgi:hypothetical protein
MPLERPPTPREITRFLSYVNTATSPGHWIWTGYTDHKGYGQFWFNGKQVWAHRFSLEVFKGVLEIGLQAHHDRTACGISSCVNPSCLAPATAEANGREGALWQHHSQHHSQNNGKEAPAPF